MTISCYATFVLVFITSSAARNVDTKNFERQLAYFKEHSSQHDAGGVTAGGKYQLPKEWVDDIHSNKDAVKKIIDYVRGPGKHRTFHRLANITDTFGHREIGSDVLENIIDYVKMEMEKEQYDNVHLEEITAPKWVRGKESAKMMAPREEELNILSFGSSVGTDPAGITAEAMVVRSFDELDQRKDEVNGKIVVFNQEWKGYSATVKYRYEAAWRSSKYGAVAALVRSMTGYSIDSPHTGIQTYNTTAASEKIPSVAITVEDAEMMDRMQARGQTIQIFLQMEASTITEDFKSDNIVADISGKTDPHELVIFGGHIDSWDVGTGAMDDGGGCAISWEALAVIKDLGLQPRRTMRAVLWTAEEIGLVGSNQYYDAHKDNAVNISIMMESDSGTFKPLGIGFSGSGLARAVMDEILSLLKDHNLAFTKVGEDGSAPDISIWHKNKNVPIGSLLNDNGKYFDFHHTEGDTMTVEDPDDLDDCTILWTVTTYVIANLKNKLPREGALPPTFPPVGGSLHSAGVPAVFTLTVLLAVTMFFSDQRK